MQPDEIIINMCRAIDMFQEYLEARRLPVNEVQMGELAKIVFINMEPGQQISCLEAKEFVNTAIQKGLE